MGTAASKGSGPTYLEVMSNAAERERKLAAGEGKEEEGAATEEIATFAAGCFWGVELAFARIPGVKKTAVGYIGGHVDNPTYKQVCTGTTNHAEGVRIWFDPRVVTFRELISVFWERHDSTTLNRQGNDKGTQYRSAVFYHNDKQREIAEETKAEVAKRVDAGKEVVTQIVDATPHKWWEAENYHQQYLEKGGQTAAKGSTEHIRCYG